MTRIISLLIILAASLTVNAQVIRSSYSYNYVGLTSYSHNADVFSFTSNQAALAAIQKFSAGFYGERRYMLQELSSYSAVVAIPTSTGNFALYGNYSGQAVFNESHWALSYGRSLGKKLNVGVQFNYFNIQASEYGHASSINFDAGILLHITDQLHTGIHVSNPTSSRLGKSGEEHLPSVYSCGIGYDFSNNFFLATELEKSEGLPANVNTGMQYRLDKKLLVQAGISSPGSVYYFGLGVLLKDIRIDATANVHPYLGITPGLLLIYPARQ